MAKSAMTETMDANDIDSNGQPEDKRSQKG